MKHLILIFSLIFWGGAFGQALPLAGTETRAGLDKNELRSNAEIYHVTNLNSDGPGSFREAVTTGNSTRPRIVVFDISGVSAKKGSQIRTRGNLWVAGQTAPLSNHGQGSGFVVSDAISIRNSHTILEHITVRPHTEYVSGTDAISVMKSGGDITDVSIRNCTVLWGTDENISIISEPGGDGRVDRVEVVDTLIGEGFRNPSRTSYGNGHNYNMLIRHGVHDLLIARNLFFSGVRRNPGLEQGSSAMVVNNYAWNFGYSTNIVTPLHFLEKSSSQLNIRSNQKQVRWSSRSDFGINMTAIGNVGEGGPYSNPSGYYAEPVTKTIDQGPTYIFQSDNKIDGQNAKVASHTSNNRVLSQPDYRSKYETLPAAQVKNYAFQYTGALPLYRDPTAQRIYAQVLAGTHEALITKAPNDPKMPTVSGVSRVPSSAFTVDQNGLTRVENWLYQKHLEVGGAPRAFMGQQDPPPPPNPDPQPNQDIYEAETLANFPGSNGRNWNLVQMPGLSGGEGRVAVGSYSRGSASSARLDLTREFTKAGSQSFKVYYWVPDDRSDSFYIGLNGNQIGGAVHLTKGGYKKLAMIEMEVNIPSPGTHTINFYTRENDTVIDRIEFESEDPLPPNPNGEYEMESSSVINGSSNRTWMEVQSSLFSGGKAMMASGSFSSNPSSSARIDVNHNFVHSGEYKVYIDFYADNGSSDSFFYGIDQQNISGAIHLYRYEYDQIQTIELNLTITNSKSYTINLYSREPNLILDKVRIEYQE